MKILKTIPAAVAVGAATVLLLAGQSLAAASPTGQAGEHRMAAAAAGQPAAVLAEPVSCLGAQLNGPWVCIYSKTGYSGGPGVFQQTNPDWGLDLGSSNGACVAGRTAASDNAGGWNDCVSSIWNDLNRNVTFYTGNHCSGGGGYKLTLTPNSGISDLTQFAAPDGETAYWNDDLSSDVLGSGGSC